MKGIDEIAARQGFAILDGAMSTGLEKKGLDLNDTLWTAKALAERPELVKEVHADYLRAGADINISASYQASIPGFEARGYTRSEALGFIAKSVRLLDEARQEWLRSGGAQSGRARPIIAGDIGPYGAYLADGNEYRGEYRLDEGEYRRFHEARIKTLADAGADMIAIETQPRLDEALTCAAICEEIGIDYWLSFTFASASRVSGGWEIAELCREIERRELMHLAAVGANCIPPKLTEAIVRGFREQTALPVIVYPNSGKRYDPATKTWSGIGLQSFGEMARGWYGAGARIIGGCCTTDENDIREIFDMREGIGRNE